MSFIGYFSLLWCSTDRLVGESLRVPTILGVQLEETQKIVKQRLCINMSQLLGSAIGPPAPPRTL
ncbi:MAG TPA: hypothetical protein VFZ66_27830 [Herpetosiphonaceae bacterium]